MPRPDRRVLILAAALLFALSGCGGSGDGRIPVVRTTGTLLWPGKDVFGLMVALHPADPTTPRTPAQPMGVVQRDGRFEITSYDVADGVPPGVYVVTVREAPRPDDAPRITLPPEKYRDQKTSPLRVTIENKAENILEPLTIGE